MFNFGQKTTAMCGRYVLVQKTELLEKRFNVTNLLDILWEPSHNIAAGDYAPVITDREPDRLQLFRFGFVPSWATKDMCLINARSEGDSNKDNDPLYAGGKGIITKPAFRKAIRSQRCLVPADAFIEGTTAEKLDKPYLVYLKDKVRPFAVAGIWEEWVHPDNGQLIQNFAILTTVSNSLLQLIPHHRSPVILQPFQEQKWLRSNLPLTDVTAMLEPFPGDKMNAFPISAQIKNPSRKGRELISPLGERLTPEFNLQVSKDVKLEGMGSNKRFGFNTDQPWG